MASQDAAQTLYETAKALLNVPSPPHSALYDWLKDFQPLIAALVAACAAILAFRASIKSNAVALKKLELDERTAARDRARRKLGVYLRLRSQLPQVAIATGSRAETIENFLKTPRPPSDPDDPFQEATVLW